MCSCLLYSCLCRMVCVPAGRRGCLRCARHLRARQARCKTREMLPAHVPLSGSAVVFAFCSSSSLPLRSLLLPLPPHLLHATTTPPPRMGAAYILVTKSLVVVWSWLSPVTSSCGPLYISCFGSLYHVWAATDPCLSSLLLVTSALSYELLLLLVTYALGYFFPLL